MVRRTLLAFVIALTVVYVHAQGVISAQKVPVFGSTDSVYHYYPSNREFLKKKFFIDPVGISGDGWNLQLNSTQNGLDLVRHWRLNGSSVYYDGGFNGFVGMGTSTPTRSLEIVRSSDTYLRVRGDNNVGVELVGSRNGNVVWSTSVCRGSTASPSAVQSGDALGSFQFNGWDGTKYDLAGEFGFVTDGAVGTNIVPSRFTVSTNRNGFGAPNIRFTIKGRGNASFGIENPTEAAWLSVRSQLGSLKPVLQLSTSASDTIGFFTGSTNPGINSGVGDIAITKDGNMWQNRNGAFNGWGKMLNLRDANGATGGQLFLWNSTTGLWEAGTLPSGTILPTMFANISGSGNQGYTPYWTGSGWVFADKNVSPYSIITSTGTVDASSNVRNTVFNPGSTQASMTVNLHPAGTPADGQEVLLTFVNEVTSLTIASNGTAAVLGAPTTITAGRSLNFKFYNSIGASGTWILQQ